MFQWYKKVISNYANFNGRARRSEFWYFALVNLIFSIAATVLDKVLGLESEMFSGAKYGLINSLYSLFVLIPSIAVAVRRLHDTNKSGWYYCLIFFVVIGWIWLFILFCTEGNKGENKYGADPKNEGGSFDFDNNQFAQ